MRVLHIDTEHTWRGGEQQIAYLVDGLASRRHESRLIAQPGSAIEAHFREHGWPVHAVRMRGEWDVFAVRAIASRIVEFAPHVVHMHTSHAHSLGVLAASLAGRARRIVSRRVDFEVRGPSRVKYRHGVDRFVAITDAVASVLRRAGVAPSRISVVRSGVDPARVSGRDRGAARERFGLGATEWVVGCVGHLTWHKGQVYLVRAWPEVLARVPNAQLLFAGDGEDRAALEAEVSALGIEDSVRFLGFRPDVSEVLAALDCFALPSVMEGLGTSILDALSVGLPVVAGRAGGIPEVVTDGETGLLVPPRDAGALAEALVSLRGDPERAAALARRGAELVRRSFSVDGMVEGTLAAYALAGAEG